MKVKLILIFVVALITISVKGQAPVDSATRVKLEQYKKLLDDGTISKDEYNQKKAELLGTAQPETKQPEVIKPEREITRADTMPLRSLKERYKSKVIAGSVILSVGAGFIIGDIFLATVAPKPKSASADTLAIEQATRRGSEAALGVLGGLASVGGAVFLALGLKDKAVYRRRGKELTMNFTGKEIEIAFVF